MNEQTQGFYVLVFMQEDGRVLTSLWKDMTTGMNVLAKLKKKYPRYIHAKVSYRVVMREEGDLGE